MTKKLEVHGPKVFGYLREQLYRGGKPLSNLIDTSPIEDGKVYAFSDKYLDAKNVYDFDYSVVSAGIKAENVDKDITSNNAGNTEIRLISIIKHYLKQDENNCCILEEPTAIHTDAWVMTSNIQYFLVDNSMYYFFNSKNIDDSNFEDIFRRTNSYYFLCALSFFETSKHSLFFNHNEVLYKELQLLAKNLTAFIVSAYDGDGYLLWQK